MSTKKSSKVTKDSKGKPTKPVDVRTRLVFDTSSVVAYTAKQEFEKLKKQQGG